MATLNVYPNVTALERPDFKERDVQETCCMVKLSVQYLTSYCDNRPTRV